MTATVQIGCVLLVAALLNGCSNAGSAGTPTSGKKGKGEGAAPVLVTKVVRKDVPVQIEVIGNVEAYSTITVKALVGGELQKVNFHEGDYVKKGDLLFTIDRRPLEAALGQVEATLARDEAVPRSKSISRPKRPVMSGFFRKESSQKNSPSYKLPMPTHCSNPWPPTKPQSPVRRRTSTPPRRLPKMRECNLATRKSAARSTDAPAILR
jgi:hypothetical protein